MLPLAERSYMDKQGNPQTFASQGFVLTDGINTVYAETIGNYAKAAQALKLEQGMLVNVHLVSDVRQYMDKDGVVRYSNEVRITNIAAMTGPARKPE